MIKKFKNPFFAGALALMLVSVLGGCNGDATLKLDPTIVAGPSKVTTIEGNDTQIAVLLSDFEKTPTTVDVYKNEEETAIATAVTVSDNSITLSTAKWAVGAYKIYVKSGEVKSNDVTLSIVKKEGQKIVISPSAECEKGNAVTLVIAFSNIIPEPATVDLYLKDGTEAIQSGLSVSNNTISVSTTDLAEGANTVYVKAGDYVSNECTITTKVTPPAPVKTPAITISGPSKVTKGGNSVYIKMEFIDIEGYDFINHPTVEIWVDETKKDSFDVASTTYSLSVSSAPLNTVGKHKVYLKMNKPAVKSNEIEIETVEGLVAPEVTVKKSEIKNKVELNIEPNGAKYYHIWFNDTNDFDGAVYKTYYYSSTNNINKDGKIKYEYLFGSTAAEKNYYFWVKAANSSSESSEGVVTEALAYNFKKDAHTAPTGVTVTAGTKRNTVNLKFTDNKANKYAIYYSTSETKPDYPNGSTHQYSKDGYEFDLTSYSSGSINFWVMPCDSDYSEANPVSESASYDFTHEKPIVVPKDFTVAAGPSTNANSVRLSFKKGDAEYVLIYYGTENDSSKAKYITYKYVNSSNTFEYDYKLPAAGTYYFWLKSSDVNSNNTDKSGDFTTAVSYTLDTYDNGGISKPENVTVTTYGNYWIKINCDSVGSGTTYYHFYYNTVNEPRTAYKLGYEDTPSEIYSNEEFDQNKTYYFWVKAGTNYNEQTTSASFSVFSDAFEFIPNPASNSGN